MRSEIALCDKNDLRCEALSLISSDGEDEALFASQQKHTSVYIFHARIRLLEVLKSRLSTKGLRLPYSAAWVKSSDCEHSRVLCLYTNYDHSSEDNIKDELTKYSSRA